MGDWTSSLKDFGSGVGTNWPSQKNRDQFVFRIQLYGERNVMDQLTPEQRATGQANYYEAIGMTRRDFLRGVVGAGAVSGGGLGAMYFGYGKVKEPVRIGVIGTGDEGSVLIGGCNPEYVTVKAICDIRPYSIYRAFHGDWTAPEARPGLIRRYGYTNEAEAMRNVKVYDEKKGGIQGLLDDPEIEGVIIALPLFLHAPIAIQAMMRGKHVLTEKLMAKTVAECKAMSRASQELKAKDGNPIHLATGHQRHYNVKYDNAINLIRWGMIGQIHHIRAQWHRGNLPGKDSWKVPLPGGEPVVIKGKKTTEDRIVKEIEGFQKDLKEATDPAEVELLNWKLAQWMAWNADRDVKAEAHGYETKQVDGRIRSALEELVRWRLFDRTGAGLMAELGSHQLDAVSLFLSSLRSDGKKVHPLSVHAVGGRHIFPKDRDVEDHVYCMYEFPGPEYSPGFEVGYQCKSSNYPEMGKGIPAYETDPDRKVVVTYSSINGNGFGGYGEVVLGTKGTLILEKEMEVMLYRDSDTSAKVGVAKAGSGYAFNTQASGNYAAPVAQAADAGPVSRGYLEEIEHWAYCIRHPAEENRPRCHPSVALGDAVIALTSNQAMKQSYKGKGGFIAFNEEWFDINSNATPEGGDPNAELDKMKKHFG
jgi:predicted dehydrogenase